MKHPMTNPKMISMLNLLSKMILMAAAFAVFAVFGVQAETRTDMTRIFLEGVARHRAENYGAAISEFLKVADSGVKNSKLYYNLGNAYLKNDDLGNALLWYERALKLSPRDPDLRFNYQYALTLVKDEHEEKTSAWRVFFFWKHLLSERTVQGITILLNLLLFLLLVVRAVWKRRALGAPITLVLAATLVFALTALANHHEAAYARSAVILPAKISVRSGFTDDSTELFVLHAGARVKIERETSGFYRIYFAKGKIGWIKKTDAGVI